MKISRRSLLTGSISTGVLFALPVDACVTTTNCGSVVPTVGYNGGGTEVVVYQVRACFTNEIARSITQSNASVYFIAAFVYNPVRQTHERIKTVRKQFRRRNDVVAPGGRNAKSNLCWEHNVPLGTYMAVWVTCRKYTGWVAGQFTGDGDVLMIRRPDWQWKPSWLEE